MGSESFTEAKVTIIRIKEPFVASTMSALLEFIRTLGSKMYELIIYMNLQIFPQQILLLTLPDIQLINDHSSKSPRGHELLEPSLLSTWNLQQMFAN